MFYNERYEQDPNYRVEFTTAEPELEPELEPEVIPEEEVTTDIIEPPGVVETSCYMVHGQQHELTQQAVDYYRNVGATVTPCETEQPTVTVTPGLPTTANFGMAGILFAGVLALPILAGLGKWK